MQELEELGSPNARLRFFREFHKLSLASMGAHFGKGPTTYQHWETEGAKLGAEIRTALNDLGMSLQWLDTGEGDMLRPGVSLDVVVVDGRKQLRKTVATHSTTTGGGSSVAESHAGYMQGSAAMPVAGFGVLTGQGPAPIILPSMVALAAQMVDAVISSMPPERRPTDEKRWEAYALIARYLAEDKAEGKEGRARTFLLGLRAEWAEVPAKSGA